MKNELSYIPALNKGLRIFFSEFVRVSLRHPSQALFFAKTVLWQMRAAPHCRWYPATVCRPRARSRSTGKRGYTPQGFPAVLFLTNYQDFCLFPVIAPNPIDFQLPQVGPPTVKG